MHIVIDAREFTPYGKTGIARYLENLLKPILQKSQIKITLLLEPYGTLPETIQSFNPAIIKLPSLPVQINDQIVIPHLISRANADIFFSPYYKTCVVGKFKRIITVHDVMFLHTQKMSAIKLNLVKMQLNISTRRADVILVDSNYTAEELKKNVQGISHKIFCVYPDLSEEWFQKSLLIDSNKTLKKYSIIPPYFLYTGNFKPHKKVDALLHGFAFLLKNNKRCEHKLVLAGGDNKNESTIKNIINELQIQSRVYVLRNISDEDIIALYKGAHWCVTASTYEGFGYIVPEAFACASPIICRDSTSLGEIAAGCMLKLKDSTPDAVYEALAEAISLPENSRKELLAQAEKRLNLFAPGKAAERFLKIIEKISC